MTLIKYNPYVSNRYPGSFVNLFDKFFYDRLEDSSADRFLPSANILETEKAYTVQLAVPGMNKEDFNRNPDDENQVFENQQQKILPHNVNEPLLYEENLKRRLLLITEKTSDLICFTKFIEACEIKCQRTY